MVTNKPREEIMIIDDSREALQLLTRMLYANGFDIRPVEDGQGAINAARKHAPDLILLDISMSGMNGYEVCDSLKTDPDTEHIPIIFVSALDDFRNKVKAFELGAIDYIVKPFNFPEVLARIEAHLGNSRRIRNLFAANKEGRHRRDLGSDPDTDGEDLPPDTESSETGRPERTSNRITEDSTAYLSESADTQLLRDRAEELERLSHNLRNPIHTVSLTFNLLKKRVVVTDSTDPKVVDYFERIERNLAEISQIIAETTG